MPQLKPGQPPKRISDEEKQKMHDMYIVHNKSMPKIAKELGVARETVSRAIKSREKVGDHDRPVDVQDLVKLNRDIYRKIHHLMSGLTDKALEKSNAYQVAGAISMLASVLKDLNKATGEHLGDDMPDELNIRERVDRITKDLQNLNKLSGRLHQEKVREAETQTGTHAERVTDPKTGPKAEA